jgi:hypothetical protein
MPADYIGKWTGTSTSGQGLTASVTVDLKKGDVGDVVGKSSTTTSALGSDVTCSGDVKLISATPDGVLVQDIPGSGEAPTILGLPACSAGGQIRLKLQTDGTLEYQVKAAGTGDPKGMLTKS